jgi:hypothetical protein
MDGPTCIGRGSASPGARGPIGSHGAAHGSRSGMTRSRRTDAPGSDVVFYERRWRRRDEPWVVARRIPAVLACIYAFLFRKRHFQAERWCFVVSTMRPRIPARFFRSRRALRGRGADGEEALGRMVDRCAIGLECAGWTGNA